MNRDAIDRAKTRKARPRVPGAARPRDRFLCVCAYDAKTTLDSPFLGKCIFYHKNRPLAIAFWLPQAGRRPGPVATVTPKVSPALNNTRPWKVSTRCAQSRGSSDLPGKKLGHHPSRPELNESDPEAHGPELHPRELDEVDRGGRGEPEPVLELGLGVVHFLRRLEPGEPFVDRHPLVLVLDVIVGQKTGEPGLDPALGHLRSRALL